MRKSIGVTHLFARCENCGKQFDNYKNGQALAAKHAKQKKHLVYGDVVLNFIYDGRKG